VRGATRDLEIVWRNAETEKYTFASTAQRENFVSAIHLAQHALQPINTFSSSSSPLMSNGSHSCDEQLVSCTVRIKEKVSVFVGSWNVGESAPPDNMTQVLFFLSSILALPTLTNILRSAQWLPPNEYDIYAIGTQGEFIIFN